MVGFDETALFGDGFGSLHAFSTILTNTEPCSHYHVMHSLSQKWLDISERTYSEIYSRMTT